MIVVLFFLGTIVYGQTMNSETRFSNLFDDIVSQVESHYSGFHDKVTSETKESYERFKSTLRSSYLETYNSDCLVLYLAWFNDKHLYAVKDGSRLTKYEDSPLNYTDSLHYDPQFFSEIINKDCYLIRIPSFNGANPTYCQIVKAANKYRHSRCPFLIIDLRGNTGGSDGLYRPLQKLAYDHEGIIEGLDIRNTNENVSYLTQKMKRDPFWRKALKKSRISQSDLYCLFEQQTISFRHINEKPLRVAIIIDNRVASAAEQMLLDMKACSDRIVLYGRDSSMGCLDYSNSRPYHVDFLNMDIMIPMTKSRRLPNHPIDPHGIAPDCIISLPLPQELTNNLDEWVLWVAEDLTKRY